MRGPKLITILAATYFAGMLLTFGHEGARLQKAGDRTAAIDAAGLGFVWPVYWPFRLTWCFSTGAHL